MKKRHPSSKRPSKRKSRKGLTFYLIFAFILSGALFLLSGAFLIFYYSNRLPDFQHLKAKAPNAYSIVYSEDDELVGKFLLDNRIPIPYERMPRLLIQAFVAAEDADFFHHKGVDYRGILRAMLKNLLAGRIVQGGSTITQQVTKTFFLTPQRSFLRKLKEIAYAFGLERTMSKEEILSLYLNNIYLGNGAYGVEAAADSYFSKKTEQLNLPEIALLAGLVKAPSRYSPVNNLKRARERQAYVLTRMADLRYITPEQKKRALEAPLKFQSRESAYFSKAPYFTGLIRQQIEQKYGKGKIFQEGLRIYTTLDLPFQRAAQRSVEVGLRDLDKRQGFRGPIQTLSPQALREATRARGSQNPLSAGELYEAIILSKDDGKQAYAAWVEGRRGSLPYASASWALKTKATQTYKPPKMKDPSELLKAGDVVHVRVKDPGKKDLPPVLALDQEPLTQAALLCMDPRTGYVRAMVGGRAFSESQFNRAVYSRRQAGSAFKPLIYAAALEKGYLPTTILEDSPVEYADYDGGSYWAPKNYDREFRGPITFRNALAHSRNVVTVKILDDIGIGYALKYIKRLGIESPVKRDLSIALGSSGVSVLELATAFSVFANGGERVKPIFIKKIVTMKGEVLEENTPYLEGEEVSEEEEPPASPPPVSRDQVISPQQAFIMTHLLEGVVQHGTGQRARVLGRPIAGKTGTSSDSSDAWFIGYTPSVLTAVWVGFDGNASLGKDETGARAALPIWIYFMERALASTPVEHFKVPAGIVLKEVDLETGLPVQDGSKERILEAFPDGDGPVEKRSRAERPAPTGAAFKEAPSKDQRDVNLYGH